MALSAGSFYFRGRAFHRRGFAPLCRSARSSDCGREKSSARLTRLTRLTALICSANRGESRDSFLLLSLLLYTGARQHYLVRTVQFSPFFFVPSTRLLPPALLSRRTRVDHVLQKTYPQRNVTALQSRSGHASDYKLIWTEK